MTVQSIYGRDIAKTAANFEALTPISFLGRAEWVYPDYPALKQGLDHPIKVMTAGAAPPATVIPGWRR